MLSPKSALFTALTTTLLLASGCGADRFNDVGCVSDQECRLGRICSEGICVDPTAVDQPVEPDVGPDVGPDAEPDADDPEPDAPTELNFLGQWETNVTGQITQPDGSIDEPGGEEVIIDVREGVDADLTVRILGAQGFCPLDASIVDSNTFELLDTECIIDQGDAIVTYRDVAGLGEVGREGLFSMTFQASVIGEVEGEAPFEAYLDLAFVEGTRR